MATLKTTYKDDILNESVNPRRRYNMITNSDGTVSFEDVTQYEQIGDSFGAGDVNQANAEINSSMKVVKLGNSGTIGESVYNVIKEYWLSMPNGSLFLELGFGTSFAVGFKFDNTRGYFFGVSEDSRTIYKITYRDNVWKYVTFYTDRELPF